MTIEEREKIRKRRFDETYSEVIKLLDTRGKVFIVRPPGWGKTYLMARLIDERFSGVSDRVLYLYPSRAIGNSFRRYIVPEDLSETGEASVDNYIIKRSDLVDFMSYNKLARLFGSQTDEIEVMYSWISNYTFVVFDEAHLLGGTLVKEAVTTMKKIMDSVGIEYLGATATPNRMDNYPVHSEIFDNIMVSYYDIIDAVEDGLQKKIHYTYANVLSKSEADADTEQRATEVDPKTLKEYSLAISKLTNGPKILKDTVDKVLGEQEYMKFIVFFPTIKNMTKGKDEIVGMFNTAFGDTFKIKVVTLTSTSIYKGDEESNLENLMGDEKWDEINELDAKVLGSLTKEKGVIHLILAVDMLNLGYHVPDLTGIVMLRRTTSNIIYLQQIGRCMNVMSDTTPIVFDFVKNLKIKALYNEKKFAGALGVSGTKRKRANLSAVFELDSKVAEQKAWMERLSSSLTKETILKIIKEYTHPELVEAGVTLDDLCRVRQIVDARPIIQSMIAMGIKPRRDIDAEEVKQAEEKIREEQKAG